MGKAGDIFFEMALFNVVVRKWQISLYLFVWNVNFSQFLFAAMQMRS